jgi:hypothetical protein
MTRLDKESRRRRLHPIIELEFSPGVMYSLYVFVALYVALLLGVNDEGFLKSSDHSSIAIQMENFIKSYSLGYRGSSLKPRI